MTSDDYQFLSESSHLVVRLVSEHARDGPSSLAGLTSLLLWQAHDSGSHGALRARVTAAFERRASPDDEVVVELPGSALAVALLARLSRETRDDWIDGAGVVAELGGGSMQQLLEFLRLVIRVDLDGALNPVGDGIETLRKTLRPIRDGDFEHVLEVFDLFSSRDIIVSDDWANLALTEVAQMLESPRFYQLTLRQLVQLLEVSLALHVDIDHVEPSTGQLSERQELLVQWALRNGLSAKGARAFSGDADDGESPLELLLLILSPDSQWSGVRDVLLPRVVGDPAVLRRLLRDGATQLTATHVRLIFSARAQPLQATRADTDLEALQPWVDEHTPDDLAAVVPSLELTALTQDMLMKHADGVLRRVSDHELLRHAVRSQLPFPRPRENQLTPHQRPRDRTSAFNPISFEEVSPDGQPDGEGISSLTSRLEDACGQQPRETGGDSTQDENAPPVN